MISRAPILSLLLVLLVQLYAYASPAVGFFLPDSVQEITFRYRTVNNLIVLPVTINDSITVNLILDTGTRNLVLFGKRFCKLFQTQSKKKMPFSGLGQGKRVEGALVINNKVDIDAIAGNGIPIMIVESRNLFGAFPDVHGVIGYEIFYRFEVEINFRDQIISFRRGMLNHKKAGFEYLKLKVEDSKPVIDSRVYFRSGEEESFGVLIDTGSALALFINSREQISVRGMRKEMLGQGLNGKVEGYLTKTKRLLLGTMELSNVDTGIIQSDTHHYASIGMEVLKNYCIILNYCNSYAGFRAIS
jgi:hypothetical protein